MQAHPRLGEWFRKLKARYPNVHVSCSWRGREEQERLFREQKTDLHFPHSKHNNLSPASQPQSLALDLFQIDEDGVGRWSPLFFAKVNAENEADREPVRWGGKFKIHGRWPDGDHFELMEGALA